MSAVLCALCAIHVVGVLYFLVSRSDNQGLNSLSLAAVELATGAVRAVHDFCRQGTSNRAFRLCPVLIAN